MLVAWWASDDCSSSLACWASADCSLSLACWASADCSSSLACWASAVCSSSPACCSSEMYLNIMHYYVMLKCLCLLGYYAVRDSERVFLIVWNVFKERWQGCLRMVGVSTVHAGLPERCWVIDSACRVGLSTVHAGFPALGWVIDSACWVAAAGLGHRLISKLPSPSL